MWVKNSTLGDLGSWPACLTAVGGSVRGSAREACEGNGDSAAIGVVERAGLEVFAQVERDNTSRGSAADREELKRGGETVNSRLK